MQKNVKTLWTIAFLAIILASVTFYQVVTAFFTDNKSFSSYEQVQQFIRNQPEVTIYKDLKEQFEAPVPENDVYHTYTVFNNNGKKVTFIWIQFENNKEAKQYYDEFNKKYTRDRIVDDLERTFFEDYSYRTLILTGEKAFVYQNKKWFMVMEGTDDKEVTDLWSKFLKTL